MRPILAAGFLFALAFAGCSSSDGGSGSDTTTLPPITTPPPPPPPPEAALTVATTGIYPVNPGFAPATLSVQAGANVTLTYRNAEILPLIGHNWVLEGVSGASTATVAPGASETIQFTAPVAGSYAYYCSIGDHRSRGMEGTMTVTA